MFPRYRDLPAGVSCGSTRGILTLFPFFHQLRDTTSRGHSQRITKLRRRTRFDYFGSAENRLRIA